MDIQTAEASPSPSTAVAAAPDTSQSQPTLADLEGASEAQLEELLTTGKMTLPPKPGSEGKISETPPAVEEVEAAPGEQPAAEATDQVAAVEDEAVQAEGEVQAEAEAEPAVEAEAVEEQPEGIERPRFKDERDQLVVGIYKKAQRDGKPISWAEAEARVDGPKSEEAPVVEAVAPVDHSAVITGLETELAGVNAQLDGFEEGLSTKEIRDLQANQQRIERRLEKAKDDLQTAAQAAKAHEAEAAKKSQANRDAAHAQALQEFPDAGDDKTPLGKWLAKRVVELKDKNHPDHATLFADRAPLLLARDGAAELGIAPVAKKKAASPPISQTVQAPPRKVVAPAPGNKTAVVPGQPAEDGKAQVNRVLYGDDVPLADLDAVQGMPDPSKMLVGAVR